MRAVTLKQLQYFVTVAEELHFRRAAERLQMSQPPLSAAVADLERALATALFSRSRRHVQLTDAGEVLLVDARRILGDLDEALEATWRAGHGHAGRLRVGFVGSAVYGVLPDILRVYKQARPDVELVAREQSSTDQLTALRNGDLDVGFLRGLAATPRVATRTVHRERLVAALPDQHPLAARARVPLSSLGGEPFVLFPRAQAPELHDAIVAAVAATGRPARIVQQVPEMHTIIGLVAGGMGVSLVPESVQSLTRRGVVYRPVSGAPRTDLVMVSRRAPESALVDGFLATVGTVTA